MKIIAHDSRMVAPNPETVWRDRCPDRKPVHRPASLIRARRDQFRTQRETMIAETVLLIRSERRGLESSRFPR